MSVAISWANKKQLAKCAYMVGFPISSHILHITYTITQSMVPFTPKVTLACSNMRVFLYFCQVTRSELVCVTRELTFV